ncbi:tRNA (adenosine(37)-N6)-threonylcarbamoyltransferase complex dimerization subunit type 1 TsaB [Candidatus Rhabdochlamydia porcellionis]|jgi:tRNA threonylcarbamoyl adenosine modification protein YeaZ|uniref:tRNA threonylcarbamoyl adenosine modification protein YeaZ n=1 Tax=Candidatus Rhabdochlamydia porcellionis TaxID=225148 RepID=A0ABX8Z1Y6_9BACT|nr:tRNA (adenosine(37)-N6)-threonylcarbamoyltransferase complex dimerization subunit type 1 TsaB [Candidatus Rhabdochlamydia porcellionis]QZA58338.1 tRNA threonylcarbamoyl adenosine modification protein YeaZ [Candidatus Rhabdochlamydia porcellionis]
MYTLILDTSSKIALIAVAKADTICACLSYIHENQLSTSLFPSIERLLASYPNIDKIAVGIGPGSYTGTRVGVTIARTLSFGLKIVYQSFYSPLAYLPHHLGRFSFLLPHKSGRSLIIQGVQKENFLESKDPEFIESQEIYKKTIDSDYIVSDSSFKLSIPCYLPTVNPQALLPLLNSLAPNTENKKIFYHHTFPI